MHALATKPYDAPLAQTLARTMAPPRLARAPRASVCLLAPSQIIGEAFGRALATGGWAVDVVDASSVGFSDWSEGRTVVIVFESLLRSVPLAVRRAEPGHPALVVVKDGSSALDRAVGSHPIQGTIESLLETLGEASDMDRLGSNLTARHRDILQLVAIGYTTEEVGERLGIASKTVNNHLSTMYRRMHAKNLTQAVLMAVRAGLVDFTP